MTLKRQLNCEKQWNVRWGAKPLICLCLVQCLEKNFGGISSKHSMFYVFGSCFRTLAVILVSVLLIYLFLFIFLFYFTRYNYYLSNMLTGYKSVGGGHGIFNVRNDLNIACCAHEDQKVSTSLHKCWLGRTETRSFTLSRPGVENTAAAFTGSRWTTEDRCV